MCGRFSQDYTWKEIFEFSQPLTLRESERPRGGGGDGEPGEAEPRDAEAKKAKRRYNLAPTQKSQVLRLDREGRREIVMLRWGLIPSWAKDETIGSKLINARKETVAEKPAFREAFRKRRCLVPVSGFYEWSGPTGRRQPHHVVREDRALYALAGLWESWRPKGRPDVEAIQTFTIITTKAQGAVAELHERMPVTVAREDFDAWLSPDTSPDELRAIIDRASAEGLRPYRVSPRLNDAKQDDPGLIQEVPEPDPRLFD